MHICKLSRRKIARTCIFLWSGLSRACTKDRLLNKKSHCASNIFLRGETLPKCPALLHCSFGGNPPAGKGRAEVRKNNRQFLSTCRLNAVKCHINVISIRKKCVYTQKMQIEFAYIKKKQYLCTRKKCVYTQKMQIA